MQPPSFFALQVNNVLISIGIILCLMLGTTWWTRWEWSAVEIGIVTTLANFAYGAFVSLGGQLADRWGRAKSGILGASLGSLGCLVAMCWDHPVATVVAAILGFIAGALFYPGSAGLHSDVEGSAGRLTLPLHAKVRRYNLGWAIGNMIAFIGFGLLDDVPRPIGYAVAGSSFFLVIASLWRYRSLKPKPVPHTDDRSPHPAIPLLTRMYRVNLFLGCVLAMGLMTQIQKGLSVRMPVEQATDLASVCLTCFAAAYILAFVVLGSWRGWILRPWALCWSQQGFLLGGAGLLVAALQGWFSPYLLALCGVLLGTGYGAAYVGSIYYSLRVPGDVGRSAGWHETFIGMGNASGPLIAGSFMSFVMGGVIGLATFIVITASLSLVLQAVIIPRTRRLFPV